jgi:Uma2 family endonuclease
MTPPEEDPLTTALNLPGRQDWTVDDLASLPEDLRYELIDGRLILPSPTAMHQFFGVEVTLALRVNCPVGYVPIPDLSLKINYRNEPRPDVVVIDRKHFRITPVPVEDALLAVEIISPSSRLIDTNAKMKNYAAAGVPSYWIIDPSRAGGIMLTEYALGDSGRYEFVSATDEVFTTEVPYPVTIDLPALTAERDASEQDQPDVHG